jgi:hypothetical protein
MSAAEVRRIIGVEGATPSPFRAPPRRAWRGSGEAVEKTRTGESLMKPLTMAIIGALVVAVAVFGYLYYQRTSNDITIQVPKVELKN